MRRKQTLPLAEIIKQVLKEQRLERPLLERRIIDAWPLVLGQNIMMYTTNLEIRNKVLYVQISSSVLRNDLFISRSEIKDALNKYVGEIVISDIVMR